MSSAAYRERNRKLLAEKAKAYRLANPEIIQAQRQRKYKKAREMRAANRLPIGAIKSKRTGIIIPPEMAKDYITIMRKVGPEEAARVLGLTKSPIS